MAFYGIFVAADSWLLPRKRGQGLVVAKTFTPAHTNMIYVYNDATKTSLPQLIPYPDDWSVAVKVGNQQDSISVEKDFYNSLSKSDFVMAEYVEGRLSGKMYLKSLSRI